MSLDICMTVAISLAARQSLDFGAMSLPQKAWWMSEARSVLGVVVPLIASKGNKDKDPSHEAV